MWNGRTTEAMLAAALMGAVGCADAADSRAGEGADVGPDAPSVADSLALFAEPDPSLRHPEERHLRNVRQLTFGGENAEAYFSFDGTRLIYQSTSRDEMSPPDQGCDQIYTLDLETGHTRLVSTGDGRTTCAYFYPSGERILYSSTHHVDEACPPRPDYSRGYVWPIYPAYDIFAADADGSSLRRLTDTEGYDAEATFSPTGHRIVFTSVRDGDLEIYSMAPDGSDVRRLTDEPGYDGGPFYSPDGTRIVYRAHHPDTEEALRDYRALLAEGLIRPTTLEIYVMDADGSNRRQLTDNGAANFAPYWHPSGNQVIFSSNLHDPSGRDFDLYLVDVDGTGEPERVTFSEGFDGFPVFSPDHRSRDGARRWLVWGSNRNNELENETNIFIAEWVD